MRTVEISAAGHATCELYLAWSRTPRHQTRLQADLLAGPADDRAGASATQAASSAAAVNGSNRIVSLPAIGRNQHPDLLE